jgi:YbgC/YbaW family acyl-CoA thioester hydrolase
VEFSETDAAGIAHFASLLVYMEQAEHGMLRSLGLSVFPQPSKTPESDVLITWPRVHVSADFFGPAHFEDVLRFAVTVKKLGESSVTYGIDISGPHGLVAKGTIISVCCLHSPGKDRSERLVKHKIPESIRSELSKFLHVQSHAELSNP